METLSHRFIEALLPPRDALFQSALARTGAIAAAEVALQTSARLAFQGYAADSSIDIPAAMEKNLAAFVPAGNVAAPSAGVPMPADIWARLAAAVQVEAANSSVARALNPDSVLLRPDPMLAPKKTKPRHVEEFNLSSPTRLLAMVGMALLVGLVVTLYIVTRPMGARSVSPASPATKPQVP